jgi:hypothetical protein
MITRQDDEETPLLQQPIARTPLPWDQFWIIQFSQLSDPLSSQTLAPFTPQVSIFPLDLNPTTSKTLSSSLETLE